MSKVDETIKKRPKKRRSLVLKRKLVKRLRKRKAIYKHIAQGVAKRQKAEKRFRIYGLVAVIVSFAFLGILLTSIVTKGYSAFLTTKISLNVSLDQEVIDPSNTQNEDAIQDANYSSLLRDALQARFPEATSFKDKKALTELLSSNASYTLLNYVRDNPNAIGTEKTFWFLASSDVDMFYKGYISEEVPERRRRVKDNQIEWLRALESSNQLKRSFNTEFFTSGDSREPEQAGILGGLVGSIFVILSCMLAACPLGIATGIYLECFAPKNRVTELIEVNINNLAAVPSIVFGLLGLTVYLQLMHLPRSAALVGGLTLAMLVLPVIVITTRTAIKAVPPSIGDAALALGASRMQMVFHHLLPLAVPGIMTGVILGIARALGETAPLLMIGMIAFVVDIPTSWFDASTALPVQVYLWSDSPELGFVEKTSAAIIVLLALLILLNAIAVWIRRKYERKW